jgi:protein-tyrosine phosphatase
LHFADIHNHLLPGIDDGAADWGATLAMARAAAAEGIRTVIATPHQLGRYGANTAARIRALAAEAQSRIVAAAVPLTVLPGADVRVREDLPELVQSGEVLTLGDRRAHLLLELPNEVVPPLGRLLYRLACLGVGVILSHPERHLILAGDPDLVRPWVRQGCLVQVTAGSITGRFGAQARRASRRLIREGLAHLVATDAHDTARRPPLLRDAHAQVVRWVGFDQAQRLFVHNPQAVAAGQEVQPPLPVSAARRGGWWRAAVSLLFGDRGSAA